MKKLIGRTVFAALIVGIIGWLSLVWPGHKAYAQGGAGYVKVNTSVVTTTTFTDSNVSDAAIYTYEITGVNGSGESGPSPASGQATIPATGAHSVAVSWGAVSVDTGYNVYRFLVSQAPLPPAAAPVVVVN